MKNVMNVSGGTGVNFQSRNSGGNNVSSSVRATILLALKDIHVDDSFWARAGLDDFTVAKYRDAILLGETFPLIVVTQVDGEWVIVDGVHRFQAYKTLKNDDYEIECLIFGNPGGCPVILESASLNRMNGLNLTSDDLRKVANTLYRENFGAPIDGLAKKIGIDARTLRKYVGPLEEEYKKKRDERIAQLRNANVGDTVISKILKEEFPFAKGISPNAKALRNSKTTKSVTNNTAAVSSKTNPQKTPVLKKTIEEINVLFDEKTPVLMVRNMGFLRDHLRTKFVEEIKTVVENYRLEELKLRKESEERKAAKLALQNDSDTNNGFSIAA